MLKKNVSALLCILLCIGVFPAPALAASSTRDISRQETLAADLKGLGLFQGTDTDFDLEREPSRAEALVMLVRVLGKEREALSGTWKHPFTDVASWADQYVGYAYEKNLTNGVSATSFGAGSASAGMYLTFVLRALGYSDADGADFSWDDPFTLAERIGILPDGVNTDAFWRADVVMISYAALPVTLKGSSQTLAAKLIAAGVFTRADYDALYDAAALEEPAQVLTAKQIFQLCSPAVFSLETYASNGDACSMGSGFFLDESGIAVTNLHVLRDAHKAQAVLPDGSSHAVTGVLLYDSDHDYAVIQVEGSGFSTLKIGDSSALESGEEIYAIGNPDGLTNSISDGIVSNPSRADLDGMIQITAPISSGSSGGALLNAYGKVVGITTASLVNGQNLNFAVPIRSVLPEESVTVYASNHSPTTLDTCAADIEAALFENTPILGELNFYEIEPNDSQESGNYICNGLTVFGHISEGNADTFLVQCNAKGTMNIILGADTDNAHIKDLMLTVRSYGNSTTLATATDYETDSSGGKILTCPIPAAGVYTITLRSGALYQTENLDVDYLFYYLFKPDGVTISDSGT